MKKILSMGVLAASMAFGATAMAQGPSEAQGMRHEGGRGHRGHRAHRLQRLAAELELNDAQIARVRSIFQEARAARRELRSEERGPERQAARQAFRSRVTGQIEAVLTPAQVEKFRAMRARGETRRAERRARIEAMSPEERRDFRHDRRERREHRRERTQ
jgi:Spy/CpxP family protein refolding chaperone